MLASFHDSDKLHSSCAGEVSLNSYSTYKYMKVSRFGRTGLPSPLRIASALTLMATALLLAIFGVSGSMAATRAGSTSQAHKIG